MTLPHSLSFEGQVTAVLKDVQKRPLRLKTRSFFEKLMLNRKFRNSLLQVCYTSQVFARWRHQTSNS